MVSESFRKSLITLVLGSLGFLLPPEGISAWITLVPSEYAESRTLSVSGRNRTYFSIEKGNHFSFQVKGPTQIRVLTRLEFPGYVSQSVEYGIRYTIDDQTTETVTLSSRPAETARDPKNPKVVLGYLREICLDVPRGVHSYALGVSDDVTRVWVRIQEQEASFLQKLSRVAMAPQQYSAAVDLEVKEKIITYYRVGGSNQMVLNLIGPTNLKILTRLEFDQTMSGLQKFRFQVLEADQVVKTYAVATEISDVAKYIEPTSTLLSKGEAFYLDVPKGSHSYRIALLDENRSALFKFYIPVKDMENEL